MDPREGTRWIVEQASSLGFDLCGVARAENWPELGRLPEWLERGHAGEMAYLHDGRRRAPSLALAGARSVIVCALNYNTATPLSTEAAAAFVAPAETATNPAPRAPSGGAAEPTGPQGWISRYAWGEDYHTVVGERLEALVAAMRKKFPQPFEARAYVDTGPVIERVAAKYAGLGWLGKNTSLINERLGSWLFLGVVLTTMELEPSVSDGEAPPADLCGNCRLCLDACPTQALVEPYLLDARRCLSYLTIELRGAIPEEFRSSMGRMVFGCDICQDVCPWNRKAPATRLAAFQPASLGSQAAGPASKSEEGNLPGVADGGSLLAPRLDWLATLTEEEFRSKFHASAVSRAKWRGLVRNTCVALGNCAGQLDPAASGRIGALLARLAASPDGVIAEHARWALARLRRAG